MKIEIKNVAFAVVYSFDCKNNTLKLTVDNAIKKGVDLRYINLNGEDLRGLDFSNVELNGAELRRTDLVGANFSGAKLRYTDLRSSNLRDANLRGADLSGANLSGTNLSGANLSGANLSNIVFDERTSFFAMQCPSDGDFIAWKKADNKIIKLLVTGKRSSATTLKCRCSEAKILEIQEIDGSISDKKDVKSDYYPDFRYVVGETVSIKNYDDDRWNECSSGIHFFMSREMAVIY